MKTFANEMCRFICESLNDKTKQGFVLSTMSPRNFTDFQQYFRESFLIILFIKYFQIKFR